MNTIHLQGIGEANAKAAGEFKVGERMLWNYGIANVVVGIEKETAKTITFTLKGTDSQFYSCPLKKTRLVGVAA